MTRSRRWPAIAVAVAVAAPPFAVAASAAVTPSPAAAQAAAKPPATSEAPRPETGESAPNIVGGTAAAVGAYPFFVSILSNLSGGTPLQRVFCGATLISSEWVMTAGHCIRDSLHVHGDVQPSEITLVIGRTTLTDTTQGQTRSVDQILVHPNFTNVKVPVNDVALLHLSTPSTFPWARLALPGDPLAPGASLRAIGHGSTVSGGGQSDALRQVDLPVQSDATMQSAYGSDYDPATMIGAGPLTGGMDTCQGDSGGPLFVASGIQVAVVGITSWGNGCAQPNFPGVYGEVWQGTMRSFVDATVARPANDNFAAAQSISGPSGTAAGDTTNATGEVGEPGPLSLADTTVWYSWTAPASGTATFNLHGAPFDTVLDVYTGSAVGSLAAVASNDQYGGTDQSKVTFPATSGTTYRIQVDGFNAAWGAFNLQWALNPPGNDDFAGATPLTGVSGGLAGTTVRATEEPGEPASHGGVASTSSVWYRWTPVRTGPAGLTLTGVSGFTPGMAVYTGSALTTLTPVTSGSTSASFAATAGLTYWVAVAGAGGGTGTFTLNWTVSGTGRPAADFDGNGASDVSVFRPSSGVWYAGGSSPQFGAPGDLPVPGDYGGKGKTDQAVFRPASNAWFLNTSPPSSTIFGIGGDIPVPADYDGDGLTDIAVFRPSTGVWYVGGTSPASVGFGTSGDIPVPGDYNGDGRDEPAVYRPSTGVWYLGGPSPSAVAFGLPGDIPVPADYDGDGKTDLAVYRPSTNVWYVQSPATSTVFGVAGDQPMPGDYNGDGKAEIAVYRPSTNAWYIAGPPASSQVFGASGDVPLPLPYGVRQAFFSP